MSEPRARERRLAWVRGPELLRAPSDPQTLPGLLRRAAERFPGHGVVFLDAFGSEQRLDYPELLAEAERRLAALRTLGLRAGDRLILLPRSTPEFVALFWGCLLGGIVPAPLPLVQGPLANLRGDGSRAASAEVARLLAVWRKLGRPLMVVPAELAARRAELEQIAGEPLAALRSIADLESHTRVTQGHDAAPEDLAYLLFSSGSTSDPKGVMVSHAGSISNLLATRQHNDFDHRDVTLAWAPLYHVIGLTCFHLLPVATGATQVLLDPLAFVQRPELWLEAINRHRVAFTGGPNFAFSLACERVAESALRHLDLSCLKVVLNGGEVVSVATLRRFYRKFKACGLRSEALAPAFGMSETAGGVCYPRPTEKFRAFRLDRPATPGVAAAAGEVATEYANLGYSLPGLEVRIVDDRDQVVLEREVGHVQVRGAALASGYWGDEQATAAAFVDGWLRTGDLGFLSAGQLAIVGRSKDVIIVHGHNYYAHDLEQAARDVEGIVPDRVVAASCFDPGLGRERVVMFVAMAPGAPDAVREQVAAAVQRAIGVRVDAVFVLAADEFPRTPAGKLHRYELRRLLAAGRFDPPQVATAPTVEPKPVAPVAPQDPAAQVAEVIRAALRELLVTAADSLDDRTSFVELGLDSVLAVRLARDLEDRLAVRLPATTAFEFPNVATLAAHLAGRVDPVRLPVAAPRGEAAAQVVASQGDLPDDAVALVGMAGRFPGAADLEEFWQNLAGGRCGIVEIPPERWSLDGFYDPRPGIPGKSISKWAGMLDDPDLFDPRFFGISPHEAQRMDPQQRLLVEVAWEAIERAGLAGGQLNGSATGVFVGISLHDYLRGVIADPAQVDAYTASGNFLSIAANRLSYLFDLKGPSLAVDTGCSSSLVALHLAVESLRRGECDAALVGTAHLHFTPELYINFSQAGMLAADGRVKAFDRRANGYVRGEGVAAVVLKRLRDAVRDGDPIVAVVRGTAVNQDGRTNGLTAPNVVAQVEVLQAAWRNARVEPRTLGLVEAHGTGTSLGDPIEVDALVRAFDAATQQAGVEPAHQCCALGSVKTNIGHLEPASGLAGLLKAVLAMRHRQLPPTLNFEAPNELLRFDESPFYIVDRLRPWIADQVPRRACVSSFGFGGTNAHVVLEEPPAGHNEPRHPSQQPAEHLFVVSARSAETLVELAGRLASHLRANSALDASAVARTLATGRTPYAYRLAIIARSLEEFTARLDEFVADPELAALAETSGTATYDNEQRRCWLGFVPRTNLTPTGTTAHASEAAVTSLAALAASFVRGTAVDWSSSFPPDLRRVELPPTPLQRQRYWIGTQSQAIGGATGGAPMPAVAQPDTAAPSPGSPVPSLAALERRMTALLAEVLEIAPAEIAPTANYMELGLDSLMATRVAKSLDPLGRLELDALLLFTYPSVRELAAHLAAEHPDAFLESAAEAPQPEPARLVAPVAAIAGAREQNGGIAIVGMACRFPGADSPEELWRWICAGGDAIRTLPLDRATALGLADEQRPLGGWLDDVAGFDPALFGITPREARYLDPQQRLLLELTWEACERAGYSRPQLARDRVGVFVGASNCDYLEVLRRGGAQADPHVAAGNALTMLANRISYAFDLQGPSLTIDTACSSSLVAVHLACEALERGEIDAALVGGVNLILDPERSRALAAAGMLSPNGRCRTFDAAADGYVRSEGAAMVVLRPLAAALAAGDRVLAVIRGTAVNHDGHSKVGVTAPNPKAQVEVLASAYRRARAAPESIGYLEAHGTGTPLGDPIEWRALGEVFRDRHAGGCAVASIKSRIGHLEAAAGMAGLFQAVLALSHRQLPPNAPIQALNPHLDIATGPLFINDRLRPWASVGARRAGVSSFGAGGTNAHAVLEEAPGPDGRCSESSAAALPGACALVLSARSSQALEALAARWRDAVAATDVPAMADLCFTAATTRVAHGVRMAIVARSVDQLSDRLQLLRDWTLHDQLQGSLVFVGVPDEAAALERAWEGDVEPRLQRLSAAQLERLAACCVRDPSEWELTAKIRQLAVAAAAQFESRPDADDVAWWTALALVWTLGAEIDWPACFAGQHARRVAAPTYPFEHQPYWVSPPKAAELLAALPRPEAAQPAIASGGGLLEQVVEVLAQALEVAPDTLDVRRPLVDQGLDSILATRIARELGERFGERLPATLCFEFPTAEQLAAHLAPQMRSRAQRAEANLLTGGSAGDERHAIAVIGFGGRFPQSESLEQFWQHLLAGSDLAQAIPAERAGMQGVRQRAALLAGIDRFDAEFFQVAPREAAAMDPQQRLLLEVAWETLEMAGYAGDALTGSRTGVFVGGMASEYLPAILARGGELPTHVGTGNALSVIANRTSYFLNLKGPCLAVDTACSSSLVAVHLAVASLRRGECDYALAAGTQVGLAASHFDVMGRLGVLSPTGRCQTFGAAADGYVLGEGVGAVLLKPLQRALAEGDAIYGVLLGSAMNHGGEAAGLTVPSPQAQAAVIRAALNDAHVLPETLSYIEAHGTGTRLGDPIEIAGLRQAFAGQYARRQSCAIGSVKSNVGHLEPAAGIAGLIKVLLALRHETLPPHAAQGDLNPALALEETPFWVNDRPWPWPGGGTPRRAGVSAFGFGGTNAHVVVEEPPTRERHVAPPPGDEHVLVVSARTEAALREQCRRLAVHLSEHPEQSLGDICATAALGRRAFKCRFAAVGTNRDELIMALRAAAGGDVSATPPVGPSPARDLARQFLAGERVDWALHFGPYQKVELPTYPFQRQRYWIDTIGTPPTNAPPPATEQRPAEVPPAALPDDLNAWFHEVCFVERAQHSGARSLSGHWLVASEMDDRVADGLVARLVRTGIRVTRVFWGTRNQSLWPHAFEVDADHVEAVEAWLAALPGGPTGMVILPTAAQSAVVPATLRSAGILRALARSQAAATIETWFVTRGAWDTTGNVAEREGDAAAAAVARTAAKEFAGNRCRLVDLAVDAEPDSVVDGLWTELSRSDALPECIAREGRRWEPCVRRRDAKPAAALELPADGVYLIAGAWGGIGTRLARWLAQRGPARLILVGRHGPRDQEQVAALEALGARVETVQLDICDEAAVASLVAAQLAAHRRIDGVFHVAGELYDSLLANVTTAGVQSGLRAKTIGTQVLEQATRTAGRRAFVAFSSLAVAAGNTGQAVYAAGNAAADAYLSRCRRAGDASVLSVAWGPWSDVGLAADQLTRAKLEAAGLRLIAPDVGVRLLEQVLAQAADRVLAFRTAGQDRWDQRRASQPLWRINPTGQAHEPDQPATGDSAVRQRLVAVVREELARALGAQPDEIEVARPFIELGLDSLLAEQMIAGLRERLRLPELSMTAVFRSPSVEQLAAELSTMTPQATGTALPAVPPVSVARSQPAPPAPSVGKDSLPIAVVGLACRFAGADDLDAYWQLLREGRDATGPMPQQRLQVAQSYDASFAVEGERPWGGFLNDINRFDGEFFRMAPAEAAQVDPRQRLMLEAAYRAIAHAGYDESTLAGSTTGVFVGCGANDYLTGVPAEELTVHAATGNTAACVASRIAYFMNLRGPCLPVDTACSSGLVALHLAVESLRRGECAMALAGAVHLHLRLGPWRTLRELGVLSPTHTCRPFAADADGFVPGEGVAALVLKPLTRALADGDTIYGVLRGTAVNNDGRTNGLTAPNPDAQQTLVQAAWDDARVGAESIQYIEAHGTATSLGDLVECTALAAAFASRTSRTQFCRLGSVKGNLGHTDAVAGLAGLIKVLLAMQHELLPASLHAERASERLALSTSALQLADRAMAWPRGEAPRRAGVSAFGFSGTNAHVVVEEPPTGPGTRRPVPVAPAQTMREHAWLASRWPRDPACYAMGWRPTRLEPDARRCVGLVQLVCAAESASAQRRANRLAALIHAGGGRAKVQAMPHDGPGSELGELLAAASTVVYLAPNPTTGDRSSLRAALDVLKLGQQLTSSRAGSGGRLVLVTCGAMPVELDADVRDPLAATAWGLLRSWSREEPGLVFQAIDLPADDAAEVDQLLCDELDHESATAEIAFRAEQRFMRSLEPTAFGVGPMPGPFASNVQGFRRGGVYLITGGLGGVGRYLANWLIEQYDARLLLVGRHVDQDWATSIARPENVLVRALDVADSRALAQACSAAAERFGRIEGVLHAAGINARRRLRETSAAEFEAVVRPKLAGALAIDRALAAAPPEFVVYFSSVAGFDGNALQGPYSAANRALDCLAAWRSAQGRRTLSVAWGMWAEVGMGAELVRERGDAGPAALDPQRACWLLADALIDGRSSLVLDAGRNATEATPAAGQTGTITVLPTGPVAASGASSKSALAVLRDSLAQTLGVPAARLDGERSFLDLGLDSLLAIRWMRGLEQRFGGRWSATLPFDYPTLLRLAEHVASRLPADALAAAGTSSPEPAGGVPAESAAMPVDGGIAGSQDELSGNGWGDQNGSQQREDHGEQGRSGSDVLVLKTGRRVARVMRRMR
ncbi:MAG: SDR family NAD(P)-dependent oxidoreductase [Pirellulales bacterium]|nr:SDR family NAD(P)-dependent oxidoreductase [Pirellulales bacterium]